MNNQSQRRTFDPFNCGFSVPYLFHPAVQLLSPPSTGSRYLQSEGILLQRSCIGQPAAHCYDAHYPPSSVSLKPTSGLLFSAVTNISSWKKMICASAAPGYSETGQYTQRRLAHSETAEKRPAYSHPPPHSLRITLYEIWRRLRLAVDMPGHRIFPSNHDCSSRQLILASLVPHCWCRGAVCN